MTSPRRMMAGVVLALALIWFSVPAVAWAALPLAPHAQRVPDLAQPLAVDLGWATQVSAGGAHACAVTVAGGVKCWGNNDSGQLGDGTTRARGAPVAVLGLTEKVVMVSAGGSYTCALSGAGGVKCWGNNMLGQLGDGTTASRPMPADVLGLNDNVQAIRSGKGHTCALTTSRGVKCWGNNDLGQLGDGTTTTRLTPVDVVGLTNGVRSVDAGGSHACAITDEGGLKCWGDNSYGELGDGTTTARLTPVAVVGLTNGVQAVSAGDGYSCALTTTGSVKCWGHGSSGELGNGVFVERQLTPVDVVGLAPGVSALSAGGAHTCAIKAGGSATCWGRNLDGQVGAGSTASFIWRPIDVVGLATGVTGIAAGYLHTCAALASGNATCWGWNGDGQLGDGTTITRRSPVDVWDLTAYDCTAVTEIPESECRALVTFFQATNGPLWRSHAGWLRTATPCSWQGVTCADAHISELVLPANNLVDTLPAALGDLAGLERLDLHGNDLAGPLPATLGNLSALQYLDLSANGLVGVSIPPEVGNLVALQTLDLHRNVLSGPLPAGLGNWRALQTLDLSENTLSSPLPSGLADLTQLRTLDLHGNQFSGPLPAGLGRLVAAQTIDLSGNAITGTLPAGLGDAAALRTLDLSDNQLSGPLPWTWSRLTALDRLDLGHNALSGELPPEWSLLPALQHLDLSYNALEGWLPPGYGQLTTVRYLDLSFNELRGSLPAAWSSLSRIQTLSLNNNQLAGPIPSAWGSLGNGASHVEKIVRGSRREGPGSAAGWEPPPGVYLDLSCNRLSGAIPAAVSRIHALQGLSVSSNQLRSPVPAELLGAAIPYFFPEFNLFAEVKDGTQTVPPTNLRASLSAPDRVTLTWTPIEFFGDEAYEISYATTPHGPFTVAEQVPEYAEPYIVVSGLTPNVPYYFRMRTFTPAQETQDPGWGPIFYHRYEQQSNLWSDYTPLVSVGAPATPTPTATPTATTTPPPSVTATPTATPTTTTGRVWLPLVWR